MSSKAIKENKGKAKLKEQYLAIPYHILNLKGLGLCRKVLLAHIYSFGAKGCWQSNKTLAEIFMVSACTISRWLKDVNKYVYIKNPKGYYRTMWAKTHPDIKGEFFYAPKADKKAPLHLPKSAISLTQNCVSNFIKSAISLTQKCVTTNNNTNKETKRKTTAPPVPMPAGGQAPAVLAERKKQMQRQIEKFKSSLAARGKQCRPLTEQQFEKRRQEMLKALRG